MKAADSFILWYAVTSLFLATCHGCQTNDHQQERILDLETRLIRLEMRRPM